MMAGPGRARYGSGTTDAGPALACLLGDPRAPALQRREAMCVWPARPTELRRGAPPRATRARLM